MADSTCKPGMASRLCWKYYSTLLLPGLVLVAALAITLFLWNNERQYGRQFLQAEFDARVADAAQRIEQRMWAYVQILRGVKGLFAASHSVNRSQFHDYIATLRLNQRYPGMQGITFSQLIATNELEQHLLAIHQQGFPTYLIQPSGQPGQVSSIVYIEPFSGSNLRAFDFDMLTDPIRRKAMQQARDSGVAVMSDKVAWIPETGGAVQTGILIFLPVYKNGMPHATVTERRAHLLGWVGAPFHMNDLMLGILDIKNLDIDIQLYDGTTMLDNKLLHDTHPTHQFSKKAESHFQTIRQIDIIDHNWTLAVSSLPLFEARQDKKKAPLILVGGIGVSLLLALLTWLLLQSRIQALQAAREVGDVNARLQDAEERWRFALEGAGAGVWDVNFSSKQIFLSRRCKEMLGYAEHELGTSMDEWVGPIHPLDLPAFISERQNVLDGTSKTFASEQRRRCKDGTWKWVLVRGMLVARDAQGQPLRMIGTFTDISKRKHAEKVLRESEARFRMLWETTSDVVLILDGQHIIQYANPASEEVFGYSPTHLTGQDIALLQPPALRAGHRQGMARYIKNGTRKLDWRSVRTSGLHRDGHHFPLEISFTHIELDGKHIFAAFLRDITLRKRAEDEIHELNASLEQRVLERTAQLNNSNRELQAFSYSVSHDLRAPLRGIDGWSQALLEDYADRLDENGRQYLHRVRSETQRMGQLIDDLLHLSRVALSDMHASRIDLTGLANEVVKRLRETHPDRVVECKIETGLSAQGDAGLIRIALDNLLENAWKFTSAQPLAKITFGRMERAGASVFFVRDNGAGFNMDGAQKLFSPFQRMHKQSEFPGTGIGLATVQRIVRRHEGHIWAESQPGQGATFYFTLQYSMEAAA